MLRSKFIIFPMSILNWHVNSSSNFASFFIVMTHNSPENFKLIHFQLWTKRCYESPNFLNSSCQFRTDKSISFQILYHSPLPLTHNTLVNFKLIHFLLSIKGPNKSPNFETFVCSGEILPNSSCHFPNRKSLFLQMLHHSLPSWNITPLYFFSSNIIYCSQKQPIKV